MKDSMEEEHLQLDDATAAAQEASIVSSPFGESEISILLQKTISDVTENMDEQDRADFISHIFEEGGNLSQESLLANVTTQVTKSLAVPNYKPDQAVREASLARENKWTHVNAGVVYTASNALEVYLGTPEHPLELPQALEKIRQLSESTVLTARILLGLWNSRRRNAHVSKGDSVAVLLEEILLWQGITKQSRVAFEGSTKKYTEGYRAEQKQRVMTDLVLLAACSVRGHCTITINGRSKKIFLDGPYLHFTTVKTETLFGETVLGFLVSPGGWIHAYEEHQNYYLAEVDSRIFSELHPVTDRYALRIALYLTERWREQAKQGSFSTPITMIDLLTASMIEVDKRHLTTEFAPAIEKALVRLESMSIIGRQVCVSGFHIGVQETEEKTWLMHTCMKMHRPPLKGETQPGAPEDPCATAIEYEANRWGKDWLTGSWEILPPMELIRTYQAIQAAQIRNKQRGKRVTKPRKAEAT